MKIRTALGLLATLTLGITAPAQELYFSISDHSCGETNRIPVYWMDGKESFEGLPIGCLPFPFSKEEVVDEMVRAFELADAPTDDWSLDSLRVVSRCYWRRKDIVRALHVATALRERSDAMDLDSILWFARCMAAASKSHPVIMDTLKAAENISPEYRNRWNMFWECCRVEDWKEGRIHALSVLDEPGALPLEGIPLLLHFGLESGMDDVIQSCLRQVEPSDFLEKVENGKVPHLDFVEGEFLRVQNLFEQNPNIDASLVGVVEKAIKVIRHAASVRAPRKSTNGVEVSKLNRTQEENDLLDMPFVNRIELTYLLPPGDYPPDFQMMGIPSFSRFPFGNKIVEDALLTSFEHAPDSFNGFSELAIVALSYISAGKIEHAKPLFGRLIEEYPKHEVPFLWMTSAELYSGDVSAGLKSALNGWTATHSPSLRHLALWAALATDDLDEAGALVDDLLSDESNVDTIEADAGAVLLFCLHTKDETRGRKALNAIGNKLLTPKLDNYFGKLLGSPLGLQVLRRYLPNKLPPQVREEMGKHSPKIEIKFVLPKRNHASDTTRLR